MPLLQSEQNYTTEDIYNLPEGTRAELIEGQMFMMAPPNRRHQDILFSLSRKIADYIDKNNGSCKVYLAPFAVFLNSDNKTCVEPDISVICNPDKLNDNGCNGAPDWIMEIVSPGSKRMDYSTKVFKYRSSGVREYWIIDPAKSRITVWSFENDAIEEYSFTDLIPVGIYGNLIIDFSEI